MSAVISVVIPAYNASQYVALAVKSALGQTLHDIEVILIDDKSTDDTVSVAVTAAEGDPRFSVVHSSTNSGPSGARNLGLDRATGKWVALLDADDGFAPNRLESMLQLAVTWKADMVADNLMVSAERDLSGGSSALPQDFMAKSGPISAAEFVAWDRPGHGLKSTGFMKPLMRAEFLRAKQLRYDTGLRNAEDFHFYVRCLLAGAKLYVTPQAWYQYFFRSDSQSRGIEARYPQQLLAGNDSLELLAKECGDNSALLELQKRRKELNHWIPYVDFVGALRKRQTYRAITNFYSLPSHTYALHQLWQAALRRVAKAPSSNNSAVGASASL